MLSLLIAKLPGVYFEREKKEKVGFCLCFCFMVTSLNWREPGFFFPYLSVISLKRGQRCCEKAERKHHKEEKARE